MKRSICLVVVVEHLTVVSPTKKSTKDISPPGAVSLQGFATAL